MPHRDIWITGGGYVTAGGWGRRNEKKTVSLEPGAPLVPRGSEIFDRPLGRYGRFDRYTKMGCAAVALALRDAGLDRADAKRPIGIVTASLTECLETDLAYYETTREADGALSSPNLFSYTLPGIVHGECAVHFLLAGPTLAVGQPPPPPGEPFRPGIPALETALRLLVAGKADAMLAGWIESPPKNPWGRIAPAVAGALFVVLQTQLLCGETSATSPEAARSREISSLLYHDGKITLSNGKKIESLLDCFAHPASA